METAPTKNCSESPFL
jgi:hypothetical protein